MNISTIMILAAGLGKRLRPYTSNTPKTLIKIGKYTLIEKIINAYPDLGKSRALELALTEPISIEKATNKANMILFKELAELFEPQSSGPCFEAYLNLKLINEDLSIAKEAIVEQYEREEYEASQGP